MFEQVNKYKIVQETACTGVDELIEALIRPSSPFQACMHGDWRWLEASLLLRSQQSHSGPC